MKDKAHHLRHIQRKVIRSSRQQDLASVSLSSVNNPELPMPIGIKLSEPKRVRRLPKLIKARTYH